MKTSLFYPIALYCLSLAEAPICKIPTISKNSFDMKAIKKARKKRKGRR
jgi:hypothetical protein